MAKVAKRETPVQRKKTAEATTTTKRTKKTDAPQKKSSKKEALGTEAVDQKVAKTPAATKKASASKEKVEASTEKAPKRSKKVAEKSSSKKNEKNADALDPRLKDLPVDEEGYVTITLGEDDFLLDGPGAFSNNDDDVPDAEELSDEKLLAGVSEQDSENVGGVEYNEHEHSGLVRPTERTIRPDDESDMYEHAGEWDGLAQGSDVRVVFTNSEEDAKKQ